MVKKKNSKINIGILTEAAQRAGLVAMSAAMALSVLELSEESKRAVLPVQPVLVQAGNNHNGDNQVRREREETAPHFISYSEVQRTPGRSGRG